MTRGRYFVIAGVLASALLLAAQGTAPNAYVPPRGFVPDSMTALRIAEAVWIPIYGADALAKERPYRASLANGVWTVEASLPRGMIGGVAIAEIAKLDARISRVSHGR